MYRWSPRPPLAWACTSTRCTPWALNCTATNTVNVIPTNGRLFGTIRTVSEGGRVELHRALAEITAETADRFGLRAECRILPGYPARLNDAGFLTALGSRLRAEPGASPFEPMAEPSRSPRTSLTSCSGGQGRWSTWARRSRAGSRSTTPRVSCSTSRL